jgi:hypothetical protein
MGPLERLAFGTALGTAVSCLALPAYAEPPRSTTASSVPKTSTGPSLQTLGWVVTAAGASALAGGTVMFVLMNDERSEIDRQLTTGEPVSSASIHNLETYRTAGKILFVTGAVGVVTGLSLVVFGGESRTDATMARVAVGPGRVTLAGTF